MAKEWFKVEVGLISNVDWIEYGGQIPPREHP